MGKLTEKDKEFIKCLNSNWKYIARDKNGNLYVYAVKPTKSIDVFNTAHFGSAHLLNDIVSADMFPNVKWSDEEATRLRESILNDTEKEYIKKYIIDNPAFRNAEIIDIFKEVNYSNTEGYLIVEYNNKFSTDTSSSETVLPRFDVKKMYVNMKSNIHYTLKDLELE